MSEDLKEETQEQTQQDLAQETPQDAAMEAASEAPETESKESGGDEGGGGSSEQDLMAMWEEALKEAGGGEGESASGQEEAAPEPQTQEAPSSPEPQPVEVTQPELKEFKEPSGEGPHPDLEFILDIPLEVWVEIGRTKMAINDLLKLTQGSIIELNKMAGEPVEIYVNGKLMGRGEVVVVNDRFGVRLTEILSPQERIKKLGE